MTINRTVTKKLEDDDLVIPRNRRRTPTQLDPNDLPVMIDDCERAFRHCLRAGRQRIQRMRDTPMSNIAVSDEIIKPILNETGS